MSCIATGSCVVHGQSSARSTCRAAAPRVPQLRAAAYDHNAAVALAHGVVADVDGHLPHRRMVQPLWQILLPHRILDELVACCKELQDRSMPQVLLAELFGMKRIRMTRACRIYNLGTLVA